MTTKIVHNAARLSFKTGALLLILISVAIGAVGCGGPYYAAGPGYAAPGPGPYYGGSSAAVVVDVRDRPYYTRGSGYYVGRSRYVWRPGHVNRYGTWIPGHYVLVTR